LGSYAVEQLRGMMKQHRLIGEVRGLGLLMGVELVRDHDRLERASDEAERIMYLALTKGLNFKLTMGNILTLTPALTITRDQMDRALHVLDECLTEVEDNP
jgi:4-aminobutyrate aminotransferase